MKIIAVEEHVLDADLGKASMPAALAQAPYLPDWGKTVQDGYNLDRSRPQIEQNALINPKGFDMGEGRLKEMDLAGIDMQVLSYGGFPQFALKEQSAALNRAANDRLAEAVAKHPDRFAGFATLPWGQPQEAVKELKRAVNELGLKGALLNGRPSEHFIDHSDYEPLLAAFHELNVPLYLHPGVPVQAVQQAYYGGFSPEI
ncbi:amidohydrolase family protein [[Mannheimia] succiniciproducens]|nr:amidohydrolase family protein [[Mannheimia] succiniciproducens]